MTENTTPQRSISGPRQAALVALDAVGRRLDRAAALTEALWTELMVAMARPEDWATLTARAYNRHPRYRGDDEYNAQLFDWEEAALAKFFPPAPARVLVGACGAGRELHCLAMRGFAVVGFDPAPTLVELSRGRVDPERLLACEVARFDEVAAGLPAIDRLAPYDAVVLGFGSLSHVPLPESRVALLRRLRRLSPAGPLVLSWSPTRPSRMHLRVRKMLGRIGLPHRSAREHYTPQEGFFHGYRGEEIFSLAAETGYRVASYDDVEHFPHAVFVEHCGETSR